MKIIPWISENVSSDEYSKLEQVVDKDTGYTIVNIPVGFHLWKGMRKTNLLTSDPLNYRAQQLAYFSTEPVATTYESEVSGDTKKYEFITLKPLKLLVLLNNQNLKLILKKAIKDKYEPEHIKAFMATTGIGMTYEQQIKYFEGIREIQLLEIPKAKINIGPGAIVGTTKNDIHRVSVHTPTDKLMAELICKITNLDGYIAPNTPTFIVNPKYPLPYLQEEIMICKQATNIEITVGGVIPDFIGLQGYIIMDKQNNIVKKYYNHYKYKDLLERDIVMAKYSHSLEGIVKTKFIKENNNFVFISKIYDSNLEDYLIKNIEKISERELELIVKRCSYIINELNKKKILHHDTHLRNFLIIKNPVHIERELSYTIDLGDFGWSYVLNYPYRHQTNTDYLSKIPTYIKINSDLRLFYWRLGTFCSYFYNINPVFRKYKIPEIEELYNPSETYFEFYFKVDKKFKKFMLWNPLIKHFLQ